MLLDEEEIVKESVICFEENNQLYCQSKHFLHGIPRFLLVIFQDLTHESYFHGVKICIHSLTVNKHREIIDSLSKLRKAVSYLNSHIIPKDHF